MESPDKVALPTWKEFYNGANPETFKSALPSMAGWEDSVGYNPEQMFSIQKDKKPFYQCERFDKTMVVLHPS